MALQTYIEADIPRIGYGQMARIALCDTFAQAAQARADGFHGAIVYNDLTRAYEQALSHVAQIHAEAPEEALRQMAKARAAFTAKVMEELACTKVEVSTEEVRGQSIRPYPHTDLLVSLYFLIIASENATILYPALPNHIDRGKSRFDSLPTADGGRKYIINMDYDGEGLTSEYVPPRGSAVVLFPYNGRSLPHREPLIEKPRALSTLHFS